ncbi:DUF5953 family protein [Stigmatella sp. ncwal1]|uniref:DUF5953 family protein n=1 Tax=Stigmatella ashevillensis TaxID=2995309 RepID=A0ABT5DEM2_9BACT|nr:DUF5953 family protein [Stigmatella ashevillena]MDC0712024.1 DUF5953 family protein [Stigmatella ashevillena]
MAPPSTHLLLVVYTTALMDDDGRPMAVARAMEHALPGMRLEWTISDQGQFVPLPQRDAWLTEAAARGTFPMLCNGDENSLVTVSGLEIPAGLAPGGKPLCDIPAKLPLNAASIAMAADVLEGMAEGARSFWGHATPHRTAVEIARQTSHPVRKPQVPPRGLPALRFPEDIRSPEIPHRLGWLNYWSAAAARAIGFPDPLVDADLLTRARCTASGGWILRLTDAPLDLDDPTHLDALRRAYERFPEIGGRTPF